MSRDNSSDEKQWGVKEACKRRISQARTHQILQCTTFERQHVESGNDYVNVVMQPPSISRSGLFSKTQNGDKKESDNTEIKKCDI